MKFAFISFALVSALSAQSAFAGTFPVAGTYEAAHPTVMLGYHDKAACKADGGRVSGDADSWACVFDSSDSIVITREKGKVFVTIDTVGTNGHTCQFDGPATDNGKGVLIAKAPGDEFDPTGGKCVVSVTALSSRSVDVTNNGECREFCGMRARLEIEKALLRK